MNPTNSKTIPMNTFKHKIYSLKFKLYLWHKSCEKKTDITKKGTQSSFFG